MKRDITQTTGASPFPQTHWSVILGSASTDPAKAQEALERLCGLYREPIIKWFRRYTPNPQDAEDLAHDFVAHFLQKGLWSGLAPEKGRFRSFLAACMKHFLRDAWDKSNALKRGGGAAIVSLQEELDHAEEKESDSRLDIDLALAIHGRVMQEMAVPAELLRCMFHKDSATRWDEVASRLQTNAVALRQRVRRLRQGHWEGFARETANLTAPGGEAQETQYLYELLCRNLPPEPQG